MKIALETLGCKLNQAETEQLAGMFIAAGHTITSPEKADIYILNTCTVTSTADAKARQLLRKIHRVNPNTVLVALGCYVERDRETVQTLEGISLTLSNADKMKLPDILRESGLLDEPGISTPDKRYQSLPAGRTRTFIGIQDGCHNFCTYCIVPFVRNIETSVPPETVITRINEKAAAGYKEVVLTGTEVGSYNFDGDNLTDLLKRILAETDIERIRLSSLQPDEITPEILSLWKNPRMCPHFHISLQSGSNTVLKRMNRRYNVDEYLAAVSLIRSTIPDVAITTDVIAGFPEETEQDYKQSMAVCRKAGFARIHVFPYSKRPLTAAAKMSGQVRDGIRTQRAKDLGVLAAESATTFRKGFIGRTMDVLWEQQSGGYWSGYTGNYIRVYMKSKENLENLITPVTLTELFRDGMTGELIKQ